MSDTTVIAIIAAVPPTLGSVAVLITAIRTKKAINDLHVAVNSKMDRFIDLVKKTSKAEGVEEGKSQAESK